MLDGPLVFVDIDTQRDFLEPDGALYISGSEAILPNLERLTRFAHQHGIPVLATACAHTPEDREDDFPPHCVVGTRGHQRIEATAWPSDSRVVGVDDRFEPEGGPPAHLTLHKRHYNLFSHPEADRVLAHYAHDRPTFVVYGVATDYCVKAAVRGLLERGQRVALVVDAIRPVDPDTEADLLTEFVRRGAELVTTAAVRGETGHATR